MTTKIACSVCKKMHFGECRYAVREKMFVAPKTVYKNITWYYTKLSDKSRIFFDFRGVDISQITLAVDKIFDIQYENFSGFSLHAAESPENVAISIINTVDAIERGIIKFDLFKINGQDVVIDDAMTDEEYVMESDSDDEDEWM